MVALLAAATTLVNRILPGWAYPITGVVTVAGLLGLARFAGLSARAIGLDRRYLRRAAVFGLIGLTVVALALGVAMAVPRLHSLFGEKVGMFGLGALLWALLIRIPFGTVLLEEIAFRGVLPALFGGGERWRWGAALGAAALFGVWHMFPALALSQSATSPGGVPVVVVTLVVLVGAAGAGLFLHWWRHAGRGLLAPAMVHIATNCGGVLAAWFILTGG